MARKGGNPDLKGNKNSGRKRVYQEHNKAKAINLLWEKIRKKVESGEKLSEYEEKFALVALPKTIKTETDVTTGDKPLQIIDLSNAIRENNSDEQDNSPE